MEEFWDIVGPHGGERSPVPPALLGGPGTERGEEDMNEVCSDSISLKWFGGGLCSYR